MKKQKKWLSCLFWAALFSLTALPVFAQQPDTLFSLKSPFEEFQGGFGNSVSGAGDVNMDGKADVIVGALNEDPGSSPQNAGRAYVFSGATGDTLFSLKSPFEEFFGTFGISVSGAGDVNMDGKADVIVGAPGEGPGSSPGAAGRAYVFSGATGDTLFSLKSPFEEFVGQFGRSVSGAGDVNMDGNADVIVGAPGENPGGSPDDAGRAYVFSGATGDTLFSLKSPFEESGGFFGGSVSGAGDVNMDGNADVIVGANREDPGGSPSAAGRAYVFSGASGDTLFSLKSPFEEFNGFFGSSVSGAGDVNMDGHADVIVGALGEFGFAGRAYVFSGATGDTLFSLKSPFEEFRGFFGISVSGAGDVNMDGKADVIVGASGEDPGSSPDFAGRAYVFSGATGDTLFSLKSPFEEFLSNFGTSVSGAGDVNMDGKADVIVGAESEDPGSSPDFAGRAYVFGLPAVIIDIDIIPRHCPNFLDIKSRGAISVAIVGTANLDVSTINPESVRLEGIAPISGRDRKDITRPVVERQDVCDCTRGGPDDLPDLSFRFSIRDLRVALGDLEQRDEVEVVLTLTGQLRDGTPIEGKDCVIIKSRGLRKLVAESEVSVPESYALAQNYPNPFNPETEIRFQLPEAGHAVVRIYNTLGQEIRTLTDREYEAGFHRVRWDAKDNKGNLVSSGIYLYQLKAGAFSQIKKMSLIR